METPLCQRGLGRRLHWTVWDKEILHHIASQELREEGYVEAKDERIGSLKPRYENEGLRRVTIELEKALAG